ncbi:MAG: iron-containing alcohol dehydrogenase [Thermoplasmata archaeon]|nr:iron-containing alcohol dehydrogenase [Thermoplasmata archaeon]
MQPTFRSGTPVVYGWGTFDRIEDHLPEGDCFLVVGRGSAEKLKLAEIIKGKVKEDLKVFKGVEPNPSTATVDSGAVSLRGSGANYVLAVGGGSVLDAAKVIAVVAAHGGSAADYLIGGKDVPDSGYPVFAVPTTPGTSSEITPFSVISVPEKKNKVGLRTPEIYPSLAIIDPALTTMLPPDQTAATGLDILSHAVESYWSARSTPITRPLALEAVKLIREHLPTAFRDGGSRTGREGVSLASIFAGLSFSNAGTTVCHGISYPITYDTGLTHGLACSMTLGPTFDRLIERGAKGLDDLASSFGLTKETFSDGLRSFMKDLSAPTTLKEAGFSSGMKRILGTDLEANKGNMPVRFTDEDIQAIVKAIL